MGFYEDIGIPPAVLAGFDQAEAVAEERLRVLIEGFREEGVAVPIPVSAFMLWQTIQSAADPNSSLVLTCYILAKALFRLAALPDEEEFKL